MNETSQSIAWADNGPLIGLLCESLPRYLLQQRWYPAKDAGEPTVQLHSLRELSTGSLQAAIAVWSVRALHQQAFLICVPVALLPLNAASDAERFVIARWEARGYLIIDALSSDDFVRELVSLMSYPASSPAIKRSEVEQSNTSIRIGPDAILKVLRKLEPGPHPEVEIGRFLSSRLEAGVVPALLGSLEQEGMTLALLQSFVPNEGDGWNWILKSLKASVESPPPVPPWIRALARRTAQLHLAFQAAAGDEQDFAAEPASTADWSAWLAAITSMLTRARRALQHAQELPEFRAHEAAQEFFDRAPALEHSLRELLPTQPALKTRLHGDYHLGQILVHGEDVTLVDFEGEPLRPLTERRAKHIALKDVAGMLRSFAYAAAAVEHESECDTARHAQLRQWATQVTQVYLDSYFATLQQHGAACERASAMRLIRLFCIEKATYEVLYELANRPAWVSIPLNALLALAKEVTRGSTSEAPVRRAHRLPQGAELVKGGVQFRVWAPGCAHLDLALYDARAEHVACSLPMTRAQSGWHEAQAPAAGKGTRYHFVLPDGVRVPDPASRFQPDDVHGASEVIDPEAFEWHDAAWSPRPWHEAVIYEIHLGTFTEQGTFRAAIDRLPHLVALGVTALQIMPVADFPGARNWGYDGVLPYAPDSAYGRPEDFKALIDAAHRQGLMVLLDVVYNHFGPDGNYLPVYAPAFFTERHKTPWGAAINYDGAHSAPVREFIIENALYWLSEYNLDGLRLDAVHAIIDDSQPHLLDELAQRARALRGNVHLILENEENQARRLGRDAQNLPVQYTAQWNDDVHHVLHAAATGESQGYYADYRGDMRLLAKALAEGFAFQGEMMEFRGSPRGEPSAMLPPSAFVAFIQNHDQIGNRAFGDRLGAIASPAALRAIASIYLLLPQVPMLFMGEEWGATQPFPFFCDFSDDLGEAVRKGRREEFAKFPEFHDPATRERIPDPQAEATYRSAKLDWSALSLPAHAQWLDLYQHLLALRRAQVVPLIPAMCGQHAQAEILNGGVISVTWHAGERTLHLLANLSERAAAGSFPTVGQQLCQQGIASEATLSAWFVRWSLS